MPHEFNTRALVTDTQRIPYPIKWRLTSVMKENWRLICGQELYDVSTDLEQRNDIEPGPAQFLSETSLDWYRGGKAIDISGAALTIDDQRLHQDVSADSTEATFTIHLNHGRHVVRAWFSGGNNARNTTVMSPYYVTIKGM